MMFSYGIAYPVRTTSRSALKKRYKRLGGMACGVLLSMGYLAFHMPLPGIDTQPQEDMFVEAGPIDLDNEHPISAAVDSLITDLSGSLVDTFSSSPTINEQEAPEIALKDTPEQARETQQAAIAYPIFMDLEIQNGDTLSQMLSDAGVPTEETERALLTVKKQYNPRKLGVGQRISVEIDQTKGASLPIIASMTIPMSVSTSLEVTRQEDGSFVAKKAQVPLNRRLTYASGPIRSSLYQTGEQIGLSNALIGQIITAYSYDVDFQRDIQAGNYIHLLYERLTTDEGRVAGSGNIVYGELALTGRKLKIYRHTDKDGNTDFYNERGESVRKALLRTPINGARISSGFGMRNHPIMGYSKMHRGVDFAAPSGTPIYAAGDGIVDFAGRKGGYGNYVRLKHNDAYASAYAHVSRFASGVRSGKRVKQGQIIAYVGSTGASTGPHLHYEILNRGQQVNPSGVKFKTGSTLKGPQLAAFRRNVEKINSQLASVRKEGNVIASADVATFAYNN